MCTELYEPEQTTSTESCKTMYVYYQKRIIYYSTHSNTTADKTLSRTIFVFQKLVNITTDY